MSKKAKFLFWHYGCVHHYEFYDRPTAIEVAMLLDVYGSGAIEYIYDAETGMLLTDLVLTRVLWGYGSGLRRRDNWKEGNGRRGMLVGVAEKMLAYVAGTQPATYIYGVPRREEMIQYLKDMVEELKGD